MSYQADTSGARRGLRAFEARIGDAIEEVATFARTRVAARAGSSYMRDAGAGAGRRDPQDDGPLRIVTGRLERSLRGRRFQGRQEGVLNVRSTGTGYRIEIGSRVPYAAVHERGFSGVVQRASGPVNLTIPARPYAAPAARDEARRISREARDVLRRLGREVFA